METTQSMSNVNALIIEDNEYNIQILEHLLTLQGMNYAIVRHPLQLDNVIQSLDNIDIVFLDLELPNMTGFEVFELLKTNYDIKSPIVAYTVHTDKMNQARRHGFHSFLGKPVSIDRFFENIQRILNNEPVWETCYQ